MLTVSDTAYAIAVIRAEEGALAEAERLFHDPFAAIFAAAGEHARAGTDRFLSLPFFRDAIRLRTRHIDDLVRAALARGTRQVVLMGAGFDARALRLPELAEARAQVFEVDFPALLDTKRALLSTAGVATPALLHPIPCDFTGDFEPTLTASLGAAGFSATAPAVFIWEGVIPYLTREARDRTLRFMSTLGAPGSQVLFDHSELLFEPSGAAAWAARHGFPRFEATAFDTLWRRHLPGEPAPAASMVRLGIASR
jgi:methyltransferase (TIGR00027 family)